MRDDGRTARPDIVVALGATAAQALLGRSFRVTKERGSDDCVAKLMQKR